jgi:hypothetical protein
MEPSRGIVGLSAAARGSAGTTAGEPWTRATLGASVRFVRELPIVASYARGAASGASALDGFVLGGMPSSLLPAAADDWRVTDPAFGPGIAQADRHDVVELSVGLGLAPYAVRHRFGAGEEQQAFSAVGLRSEVRFDRQPIVRLPGGRLDLGVACRVEYPGLGLDERPCRELGDYAAWAGLRWDR